MTEGEARLPSLAYPEVATGTEIGHAEFGPRSRRRR